MSRDPIVAEFHELVNMTPHELETWLATDASKAAGWTHGEGRESVGHESGRRIVRILRKRRDDYTAGDLAHMHEVVGFIKRHRAQGGPERDVEHSRWRASLRNWGNDPLKETASRRAP